MYIVLNGKWMDQSRYIYFKALKSPKKLCFPRFCQWSPQGVMHLDTTRRLTTSHVPQVHQQVAVTCKRLLPKIIFQNWSQVGKIFASLQTAKLWYFVLTITILDSAGFCLIYQNFVFINLELKCFAKLWRHFQVGHPPL